MGKSLKSLKSLMQIFATFATFASAIFVGKESCKSTVRYALWSRISLIKPLQNPYLTLTRFRLSLGSNLSRSRSACAPRTPSLFKDKSQLSFPSLASLICLCMLTVGVGNAWADYTIIFKDGSGTDPINASTLSNFINSGTSYVTSASSSYMYPSATTGYGIRLASGSYAGNLTLNLSATGQIKASKITFNAAYYSSDESTMPYTITYTDNTTTTGTISTLSTSLADKEVSLTSTKTIKTIYIGTTAKKKRVYVHSIKVTAAAATSVTASPSSIAFPDNTVEVGTDEATSTITLSNGYASYGNYLYGWFEDLSDEDHCEFFVNDGSTYSYSTSGSATPTLTFSYLADAAGTFTGKFIIQGYNSSYTAVNCTIPLSVTLTSSCTNSVSIETGTPTNCTLSASAASVSTCSGTRQVTISVTPNSCYAAPEDASIISKSGTTATLVSGPTLNAGHYDYVYSFAENATGTATFNASLSTKTTYTVQYNAGATTCTGGNAITGSHDNDTKTCGTNLTLPGETFHTTGYTQTGWTKTPCGSQTNSLGGSYSSNAAQTFYPVWTPNNYTVTWKVNNENYSAGGSSSVTHGNHITTLPSAPNPPTYGCGDVFVGWTDVQNYVHGTSPLYTTAAEFPNATGDQVFYAVYADYTTD